MRERVPRAEDTGEGFPIKGTFERIRDKLERRD